VCLSYTRLHINIKVLIKTTKKKHKKKKKIDRYKENEIKAHQKKEEISKGKEMI
jgi:hypothetical protein